MSHYGIKKNLITLHEHSSDKEIEKLCDVLVSGKSAALISDAGTPGISDPGGKLIERAYQMGITISPIPGPSAVTAALSISGYPANEYLFLGYPPHKKGRKKFFKKIIVYENTAIFFESPYRVKKSLNELFEILKESRQERKIVVCRELTKKFEEIIRGDLSQVVQKFNQDVIIKGEFTIVIGPKIKI